MSLTTVQGMHKSQAWCQSNTSY